MTIEPVLDIAGLCIAYGPVTYGPARRCARAAPARRSRRAAGSMARP